MDCLLKTEVLELAQVQRRGQADELVLIELCAYVNDGEQILLATYARGKTSLVTFGLCLLDLFNTYITSAWMAQTGLRGVVALCYRHNHGVNNKVPQLHATLSEPLDYFRTFDLGLGWWKGSRCRKVFLKGKEKIMAECFFCS